MDHQSRPRLRQEKKRRDALISFAKRCGWAVGYADEVGGSRVAQPKMHSWSEAGRPLRLHQLQVSKEAPDPKALSCYGLLEPDSQPIRLRFVDGRPVSQVTTAFLQWLCQQLQRQGQRGLVLIWDNASWHVSKEVRPWLQQHKRSVLAAEREGHAGGRILPCWLPTKSPWLNRLEPQWVHGKRAMVEPARLHTAQEVESRVCDYFGCSVVDHLAQKLS